MKQPDLGIVEYCRIVSEIPHGTFGRAELPVDTDYLSAYILRVLNNSLNIEINCAVPWAAVDGGSSPEKIGANRTFEPEGFSER